MASVRPEQNNTHSLGTATHRWSAVHAIDVQTASITASGDVEIGGNLTVLGDTVQVDVATLQVEDPLISLARANSGDSIDIGFYGKVVNGSDTTYVGLYRDASDGKFKFFEGLAVEPTTVVGAGGSLATIQANIEGTITGNADTADALSVARSISLSGDVAGSASFDGSADISIDATIQAGSVENSMLANSSITFSDGVTSEAIALGQQLNFNGTLQEVTVSYDAATNTMSFGLPSTISADLSGNASTASEALKLTNARSISLSGDLSGSVSFDGTQDVSIDATIQAGSVENSMLANSSITFSDGTASDVTSLGQSINIEGTANEVDVSLDAGTSTFTVSLPNTISVDLNGNASSADVWSTARTLTADGAASGSVSLDGSADATLSLTIADGSLVNAKLANSSITVGDGSTSEAIALGESFSIQGTANEVEVAYDAGSNSFGIGLPDTIVADLTGTASTASEALKLANARSISLSGDLGGSVSFDGTQNVTIDATIQAGSVDNAMLANSSITVGDGSASEAISLGQALALVGTADEVEVAYDAASNTFSFGLPDNITADLSGNASSADVWSTARTLTLGGDLSGNVSIDGSQNVTLNATIQSGTALTFGDGTNTEDIGLGEAISFVGTADEVEVSYSSATNTFSFGLPGTITADVNGNASTADEALRLSTARTLSISGDASGSVSFDGSANADIALTIGAGAVDNSMLANSSITFSDGSASDVTALGDSLNIIGTANEVEVALDAGTSTFQVGLPDNITADLTGNADTASALATARILSVSGDASGSVSFDGRADADIALTIGAGAVENSMLANSTLGFGDGGGIPTQLALGSSLTFEGTLNEVDVAWNDVDSKFTFGLPGTITADLNGNASTASALATARILSVSGDASGSVSFDGRADADIALTIGAGAVENSMLANSSITFSDGSASDVTALGDSINIIGTANEVDVVLDAGTSTFQIGLPDAIVADLTGNADTASALATARTLSISGDASGSVSFDGSANADIALTLINDSITFSDGTASDVTALGESINLVGTANEVTVELDAGTSTFTFGLPDTIVADLTGTASNASQATKLTTARTLSISGDAAGSVSFDGTANADIALTIAAGAVENSMLANSSITVGDGTSGEAVALGGAFNIVGTANEVDVSYSTLNNRFTVGLPSDVDVANDLDVGGNLSVTSALTVTGNALFTSNLTATSANIKLGDTMLEMGLNNEVSSDHGFFSQRNVNSYTGIFFDETDDYWKVFTDTSKPGSTVDTAAGSYAEANMKVALLKAEGIQVNGAYVLPNVDGSAGQVLSTDGEGNLSFTTPASSGVAAFNVVTADTTLTVGSEYEQVVVVVATTTSTTQTLPDAASAGAGYSITMRNAGASGTVSVKAAVGDVIYVSTAVPSAGSVGVPATAWARFMSDGASTWYLLES